jgi:dephospho-CoA kinase
MLLVGLTGNIAAGKSTVARRFAEHGATIIDSDLLSRRAVEPGMPAYVQIVRRWGRDVLAPDGLIDRGVLREQVFGDQLQLEELNRIIHPEVLRMRDRQVAEARERGDRIVVCDIPLLFEVRLTEEFDRIVLVDAPRDVRLERLVRDRALRETEAMEMIAAQMPAELKRARADYVIDNTGSRADVDRRADDVWTALVRDEALREAALTGSGAASRLPAEPTP